MIHTFSTSKEKCSDTMQGAGDLNFSNLRIRQRYPPCSVGGTIDLMRSLADMKDV